jgi:glucosyl-dolichyl phosphate glucuronosyltransferase
LSVYKVKEAQGEVIAITDDDVIVDKDWISSIWQACNRYSSICFGGKILPLWSHDIPSWIATDGPYRILGGAIVSHDWGDSVRHYDREMYAPVGANLFIRRKAFEKFGVFNTELGPKGLRTENQGYMEDSELCFRFMRAGEECLYIPTAVVYHPVPAERLSKSYFLRWYFGAGKALIRMEGVCTNSVKLMGIPRYLFRHLAEDVIQWWLAFDQKRRFFNKLQTYHVLGQIAQCFQANCKSA